ncbi:plasmid recombination protein, partial [Enterovibrio norvegicus]|uniref:plasmid recombination protein n=1 Tax=Enterovibrio norvegicus TaxID=188144 RepID=UPI000382EDB9
MPTTIIRVDKHKSFKGIRDAGAHQFRHAKTPNADPDRNHLNIILKGDDNLERRVKNALEVCKIKPRKNAVLAMDGIMSLSPEMFSTGTDTKVFIEESDKFLKEKFGQRYLSGVAHLDEKTPHIHFT